MVDEGSKNSLLYSDFVGSWVSLGENYLFHLDIQQISQTVGDIPPEVALCKCNFCLLQLPSAGSGYTQISMWPRPSPASVNNPLQLLLPHCSWLQKQSQLACFGGMNAFILKQKWRVRAGWWVEGCVYKGCKM